MFKIEMLEHTADLKYRVEADTFEELLQGSLKSVIESMTEIEEGRLIDVKKNVCFDAVDELFHDFIRQGLRFVYIDNLLPIAWEDKGSLFGERIEGDYLLLDMSKRKIIFFSEVKAITYQEFKLTKAGDRYLVEFVLDV
ncbi:MAG: archease [Candidatus Hydrogenedentota bacterium]